MSLDAGGAPASPSAAKHAVPRTVPSGLFAGDCWKMVHTEDELALKQVARAFFARHSTIGALRGLITAEQGHDPAVWARLSQEMALTGLAIPEHLGGAGGGTVGACVAHMEAGKSLYSGPLLASGFAASVLLQCSKADLGAQLLAEIADGTIATVTVVDPVDGDRMNADLFSCVTAADDDDSLALDGVQPIVLDGVSADVLIVPVTNNGSPAIAVVRPNARGITRTALDSFDQSRSFARLTFDATPATLLAGPDTAPTVLRDALDRIAILLSAEQAGVASRCLELAVEYATTRIQFGQPIGQFQAIKHLLADVQTNVESTITLVLFVSRAFDAGSPSVPHLASLAKAWCSEAAVNAAKAMVQVFGGIGFTWECDAHLYLKRAESDLLLLGVPRLHREQLVQRLGL